MIPNILDAIANIVKNPKTKIRQIDVSHNRANNMGDALEEYVKDLFSGTVDEIDPTKRFREYSNTFSYLGNQNNPPDILLKGGDAIEVKKIESFNSSLALNSSYPKDKLYSSSPMITQHCRECEDWDEKDIIYAIGVCNAKTNTLQTLCLVYGIDYAANHIIYERIKHLMIEGVNEIPDIELAETKEIGRINKVDPLGITYLRVRGMWGIENPLKVFDYIYQRNTSKAFNLMALINLEKYNSFSNTQVLDNLVQSIEDFKIKDVEIKVPDNPALLKKAKLITFIHDGV